jgi:Uma2 family endonuclease
MAFPVAPIVPMTVAEYAALPEDEEIHYELQEGVLVPMASPTPEHQIAIHRLMRQIEDQMPDLLDVLSDVDIDLRITPAHRPGFVRRPDVAVVTRAGIARRKAEGGILRADEVVLAVEIVSIGSERTDGVIKHGEYADARIGHYWTIDLDGGPTLVARHLAGEFGYASAPAVHGTFTTDAPFPVRIDLDALE